MTDALLFILPEEAPSAGPTIDLVRALVNQGLIEEGAFNHLTADDTVISVSTRPAGDGSMGGGALPADDDPPRLAAWAEQVAADRFVLVNVVLADSPGLDAVASDQEAVGPSPLSRLVAAETWLGQAVNNVGADGPGMTLAVINLVVPAAAEHSIPSTLWYQNDAGTCKNLLVAPETQRVAGSTMVPINPDEGYIAHAVTSLITVAGLWAGCRWEPNFDQFAVAGQTEVWTVVRTRSRSIHAPELPRRILGRIGLASRLLPVDPDRRNPRLFATDPNPDGAIDVVFDRFVSRFELEWAPHVSDPNNRPQPEAITPRRFIEIFVWWITRRLPQEAANMALKTISQFRQKSEDALNRIARTGSSDIRITLDATAVDDGDIGVGGQGPDVAAVRRRRWRWTRPEPELWLSLRTISFGLLDGGAVGDDEIERYLTDGPRRFVLGSPERIAPSPDLDPWTPSPAVFKAATKLGIPLDRRHVVDIKWFEEWEAILDQLLASTAAAGSDESVEPVASNDSAGDTDAPADDLGSTSEFEVLVRKDLERLQAARKAVARSLQWRLGEHLREQSITSREYLTSLEKQLEAAEAATLEETEEEVKPKRKKNRRRLLIALGVLALVGAVLIFGIVHLALAGVLLIVVCAAATVFWLAGLVGAVWSWVYRSFLLDHELIWLQKGKKEILIEAVAFAEMQCSRFENLVTIHQEWADLIATLCFHPFGAPHDRRGSRPRNDDLGLPSSHQIMEGYTSPERFAAVTEVFSAGVIHPGWLSEVYASAERFAGEPMRGAGILRERGFFPDLDISTTAGERGDRQLLVQVVRTGEAQKVKELEIMTKIQRGLRDGSGIGEQDAQVGTIVDTLFTAEFILNETRTPAAFLAEAAGPDNEQVGFNQQFFPRLRIEGDEQRRSINGRDQAPQGARHLPTLPTAEALRQGVVPEFPPLVFSDWDLGYVMGVPADSIGLIAPPDHQVQLAELDLSTAVTRWVVLDQEPDGNSKVIPPGERDSWRLDRAHLPTEGILLAKPTSWLPVSGRSGPFSFLIEVDGEPLSFPSGSTIPVAVRSDCAPQQAIDLIEQTLQCVADRTGFSFVFDGTFEGIPKKTNNRIEIGWAFDEEYVPFDESAGDNVRSIGRGGPYPATLPSGERVLTGGLVLLKAEMDYPVTFEANYCHGQVLLHELGHVMNLGHVYDSREIMNGDGAFAPVGKELNYGPGDNAGFHEIAISAVMTGALAPR